MTATLAWDRRGNTIRHDQQKGVRWRQFGVWTLALVLLAAVGCGDGRPERVQVSGQVLIDGKPLEFGFVRFVPTSARPATGRLGDEGRFKLTCYGNEDGVVRGTHQVDVIAGESLSESKTKWHAPKKYAFYHASGLTETIDESTDSLVIHLTWDGGKPYVEVEK